MRHAILLLVFSFLLGGCVEKQTLPPIEDWITFNSPENVYSVLLPSYPKEQKKSVEGTEVTLYITDSNKANFAVTACCHVVADGEDRFDLDDLDERKLVLDGCIDGLKGMANCNLLEQHDGFTDSIYPMREFFGKLTQGKQTLLIRGRYIITPRALVEVIAVGNEELIKQPQILKCLDSVKIQK